MTPLSFRPALLPLVVLLLVGGCATTVPYYDPRPPGLRLEVRGLPEGRLVLRPGSAPVERELGEGEGVDLSVVAVDGGGVRRVALTGSIRIGCHDPETGARTTETREVRDENVARPDASGRVPTTAAVGRTFRVEDYRVRCADPAALPWVEGTFRGEAEDFRGGWSATATLTLWFEVAEVGSAVPPDGAPRAAASPAA